MQMIWAKVLSIEPASIGLKDRFIHLGGNSIDAMKVVGEARKTGLDLTVADIFRHQALQDVSRQVTRIVDDQIEEFVPFALLGNGLDLKSFIRGLSADYQLDTATIRDAYPCTPLQEGLLSLAMKRSGGYIMQGVFELSPNVAVDALC